VNSNLFHNILNVLIALISLMTAVMVAIGCTTTLSGGLECSKSIIDPAYTSIAVAILGGLKTVINITRDGFGGLFKTQPPVK
jgi:hypothetical protein